MQFSLQALWGQLLIGLVNGAFYAMLSIGLALIFGMLNIVNFAHGALYMLGAFVAWALLAQWDIGYWWSLLLAPVAVGVFGMLVERLALRRIAKLDHLYGLLLTFGLAAAIEGLLTATLGSMSRPYPVPEAFHGVFDLGFMVMPRYRVWVVAASLAVCLSTWVLVEKTQLGSYLRAATENSSLVRAFGVRVPLIIMVTYGIGAALAALAGVLAAPILQVSPSMGNGLLVFVFAVVVIGGMGSIAGAIVSGFGVGLIEGLTKYLWPEASGTVVFVVMALVLLLRPNGLLGRPVALHDAGHAERLPAGLDTARYRFALFFALAAAFALAPAVMPPVTVMTVMCVAVFAMAFNLLVGFGGLVSFGHAMFFGTGAYVCAHAAGRWNWPAELALLAGLLASATLAVVVGRLAIRRQGVYFAMITLALSQLVYFVFLRAPFTGGEDGIQGVPRGSLLGLVPLEGNTLYVFVYGVFLACTLMLYRILHSPFGEVLTSIRDNESRATSLGYDTARYKLAAFVISGAFAGLAGALKAIVQQMATLNDVNLAMSGDVILMSLLGGLGTFTGPVVGAALLIGMQNQLATLGPWLVVIQGLVLMGCVMLARRGIVGTVAHRLGRPL